MKYLITLSLMMITSVFATSNKDYAQLYADELIQEFDKQLDDKVFANDQSSILETENYARLLAARSYIEDHENQKESGLLSFRAEKLEKIKQIINKNAQTIYKNIKRAKSRSSVIYPSINGAGNITGNTFPTNTWSLTYDDGPHPSRTSLTVDNVYTAGIKATYFVLTEKVNRLPRVLDYILNSNMELALHSYTHPNLSSSARTNAELDYEIKTAKLDLEKKSNKKLRLFRLPYGAGVRNKSLRQRIANENLIHVFWNVDTLDWKDKDPNSILARSLKQMALTPKKSGIILFHDIHSQSVTASDMLVKEMQKQNLVFCTVGEVVNYFNNQDQDCL